jgi:hypothetical protein
MLEFSIFDIIRKSLMKNSKVSALHPSQPYESIADCSLLQSHNQSVNGFDRVS